MFFSMKNEVTKARSYCEASGSFQLNYQMTSESLGKGTFGKVCKAVSLRNGKDCAVKVVHLGSEDGTLDEKTVEEARQEEHIMHRVGRHEHCVALLETFSDLTSQRFYFVMERCGASLMDSADYVLTCEDDIFGGLVRDMAKALAHVHKKGIIHRDIKPDNLLFGDEERRTLKLCDFGLSVAASKSQNLPGRFGTMPYMSPEMAASAGHCFSTDVWLYVLIFGDLPYRPPKMCREHLKMAIITGCLRPSFQPSIRANLMPRAASLVDLVKQMLSRDRSTRPTAARVLTAVLKPGSSTRTSRVQQAFCTAPGKLKTALHLKVHFGCWKAQKSEDEDDVLGKDTQFARAVTY
ncbi:unnamed protein product [Durusdinium trenchii]|uniref:CBL-interacting protein kinase 11 (OsCIPK11) n=2 Tax=Durusdinium trenchii TaxID=1381693 RepID=A0ABP0M7I9_9DINO